MSDICGIPCSLKTPTMKSSVRQVLSQVGERYPKDLERLRQMVTEIKPLSDEEARDGTTGRFGEELRESFIEYGEEHKPDIVYLYEKNEEPIGVIAHEFGHACTTVEDCERRRCPDDEWASEMSADWYAYKWGFRRAIAKNRGTRNHLHHGPGPGEVFQIPPKKYFVTRNFVCRPFVEIDESVRRYLETLCAEYRSIKSIWVFGSRANNMNRADSDWNFLVFGDRKTLATLKQDRAMHNENIHLLIVFNNNDLEDPWGNQKGTLDGWKWKQLSSKRARYLGIKKIDRGGLKQGEFLERCEKAFRIWPCNLQGSVAKNNLDYEPSETQP